MRWKEKNENVENREGVQTIVHGVTRYARFSCGNYF